MVADVHTGFIIQSGPKEKILNKPFINQLKKCDYIIVHNEQMKKIIPKEILDKTVVIYDPITVQPHQMQYSDYIIYPCSFASDEPVDEIIEAFDEIKDLKLYITGDYNKRPELLKYTSKTIKFTGFLPRQHYENMLKNSKAIITGSKREYTFLMSAWEAVSYTKPLILTNTKCLKQFFKDYAKFYNYKDKKSIQDSIKEAVNSKISKEQSMELEKKVNLSIKEFNKILNEMENK